MAETVVTNTTDALVVNLSADGEVIRNLTRGSAGWDSARSVINTSENATLFGGAFTYITNETREDTDAWVMRFNGTGFDELNETYGGPDVNASAHSVIETADGDYLFAGSIEPFGTGMTDAWVVKVNSTGDVVWNASFGLPEANESANAIIETADGDYLFTGCTDAAGEGDPDAWLVMVNSTGTELWNRTYGGMYDDCAYAIIQTSDGSFVIGGTYTFVTGTDRPDNDAWVVKVDDAGDEIWNMTYGCNSVNATAYALLETPDDGVLFAGEIEMYGTGDYDALLVQLDDEGRDLWEVSLGGVNVDRAYSVVSPEEDCFVFAGVFNATNGTAAAYSDAWVGRICIPPEPVPTPTPAEDRASVGGIVWNDANGNGIRDDGEAGVADVRVCLYSRCKCCIRSVRTGEDGTYAFTNLEPGTYAIRFLSPRTAVFTLRDRGSDDAVDSDPNPETGMTSRFTLAAGADDRTRDAGLVRIDTIRLDLEKATNGEDADTPPGPSVTEGESVNWTYNVTNNGSVPLFGLAVVDDRLGNVTGDYVRGDANGNVRLDPGEVWTYENMSTAVPGPYANIANATAQFTVITISDRDPSHYTGVSEGQPTAAVEIEKSTNGEDADEPPGPEIPFGERVNWTYNVTNTGEVALENVTVIDSREGALNETHLIDHGDGDAVLATGERWIYLLNGTAVGGQYNNTANVTADIVGRDGNVTDSDVSHYNGTAGKLIANISIEKRTGWANHTGAPYEERPILIPTKSQIWWNYTVENTGDESITQVRVTDDQEGNVTDELESGDVNSNNVLDPGEEWVFIHEGIAVQGYYANTATVTGIDSSGNEVNASGKSHYHGLDPFETIDLELAVNGEDADEPPGPEIVVGDEVVWTIRITNSADVNFEFGIRDFTFNGESIADLEVKAGDDDNNGRIDTNESWIFEITDNATEGQNETYASVRGMPSDYKFNLSDSDEGHYLGVPSDTNQPPDLEDPDDVTVTEGDTVAFDLAATDPDGDILTYSMAGAPAAATVDTDTGAFSWETMVGDAGTYTLTLTVSDGELTDSEDVTITVNPYGPETTPEPPAMPQGILALIPEPVRSLLVELAGG
jgi:hypothetical protein